MESGYLPFPIHFLGETTLLFGLGSVPPEVSIIKELSWVWLRNFWRFEGSSSIKSILKKAGKKGRYISEVALPPWWIKPRGEVESKDSKEKHFIYKKSALEIATYDGFAKNLKGF